MLRGLGVTGVLLHSEVMEALQPGRAAELRLEGPTEPPGGLHGGLHGRLVIEAVPPQHRPDGHDRAGDGPGGDACALPVTAEPIPAVGILIGTVCGGPMNTPASMPAIIAARTPSKRASLRASAWYSVQWVAAMCGPSGTSRKP